MLQVKVLIAECNLSSKLRNHSFFSVPLSAFSYYQTPL